MPAQERAGDGRAGPMQIRVLDGLDPVDAAARLAPLGHLTFLDSARDGGLGRYAYAAADPFGIFSVRGGRCFWNGERLGEPFVPALKARLAAFRQERLADLPPFQGGAAGFLAYDLARAFEQLPLPAAGAGAVPEAARRAASGGLSRPAAAAGTADARQSGDRLRCLGRGFLARRLSRPRAPHRRLHPGGRHLPGLPRPALRGPPAAGLRRLGLLPAP